ncbi:MAG: efflux RND transporter periplasmic adaptor subunit [Acidobacteria bacterium]|nr:MAG: efflux RND transporter periplasmic adaptor subunit [Acidobacteriota bacterium]
MSSYVPRTLLIAFLTAVLAGCSSPNGAEQDPAAGGAGGGKGRGRGAGGGPVPVVTVKVEQKAVPVNIPAVGTVEAASTVQVRAQVTGQLSAVHFAEGQDVRKGQPLFGIDPRPFQTVLAQAEAVLARDTATARNQAAQQARYEDLYKRGLIPRDQYETQTATAAASQATLEADRAAVETARLNLQYTNITAPIGGRTGSLGVHAGDLVRANDTTPMVVINQLSPIYVTFSVPGRYLPDIRRYQAQKPLTLHARGQVSLPPGAQPQAPSSLTPDAAASGGTPSTPREQGIVTFIDNAIDPTTGTIKLKGTFQNGDHALWPGLFVQVTLQLSTDPNAIVVPAAAVQASQNGQYVYVIKPDRTAELRPVTVERQQGEQMVIAQGLAAGEEVVTDGQLRLTPGARVSTGRGETGPGRQGQGSGDGAAGRRGKRGVQP